MNELTREKVVELCGNIKAQGFLVASGLLIDHDAALRARLEEQANTLKQRDAFVKQQRQRIDDLDGTVADLTTKLAAVEQELDDYKKAFTKRQSHTERELQLDRQLAAAQQERVKDGQSHAETLGLYLDEKSKVADLTTKLHASEQRWHDAVTHDGTLDELAALREQLASEKELVAHLRIELAAVTKSRDRLRCRHEENLVVELEQMRTQLARAQAEVERLLEALERMRHEGYWKDGSGWTAKGMKEICE